MSLRVAMPMPTKADLPPGWSAKVVPGVLIAFGGANSRESQVLNEKDRVIARVVIQPDDREPGVWNVVWSESAVEGWGTFAYEQAMEWVTVQGGWLQSDRSVTSAAAHVWDKYHERSVAGDIEARKRKKREIFLNPDRGPFRPYNAPSIRMQYRKKSSTAASSPARRAYAHAYSWGSEPLQRTAADQHPHTSVPEGPPRNDQVVQRGQAAGTYYQRLAPQYGNLTPGQVNRGIANYDYRPYEQKIDDLVKQHRYNVYYAGGKYGRPDLENRNYQTGHLMVYDPTPGQGGDFDDEAMTRSWRKIHELSHGLVYPQLNEKYGEGRRIGRLGTHRTLREAKRAVEWEWMTMMKQRELSASMGYDIDEAAFARELNTVMHDAVHRAVTGKFTNPDEEGFTPAAKIVPLQVSLQALEQAAHEMGLKGEDDLLPKRIAMPMPTSLPEDWYYVWRKGAFGDDIEFVLLRRDDVKKKPMAIVAIAPVHEPEDKQWRVTESEVRDPRALGYGPFLYERALEWVTQRGGALRSDVKVSDDAAKVWRKYDERAQDPQGDVERIPLDPDRLVEVWDYQNSRTVDRAHDGDWTTHSYRKRKQGASERRVAMPMPTGLPPGYKMEIDTLLGVLTVVIRDVATNQIAAELRVVGEWYSPINPKEHKRVRNRIDAEQPGVVWAVELSGATKEARKLGLGAYAYEQALRWISDHGGEMMSDDQVSDTAAHVWNKYYERAEAGELDMTQRPREIERYRSSEPQDRESLVSPYRDGWIDIRKEPSLQHSYRFPPQRRVK